MKRYSFTCVVVLLACLNNLAFAQFFTDVTTAQGVSVYPTFVYNGTGVSFVDFDNDGWDDISFANDQNQPRFYKNNSGQLMELPSPIWMNEAVKSIIWADYDNDGDKDMLVTRMMSTTGLFRNDGNWQFTDVTLAANIPQTNTVFTHGGSFGDYDRDGWLDIYISNWEHFNGDTNWILHNNGDGTFTDVTDETIANDMARRSFQSSFVDINHDLWPDIFVANDKNTRNSLYLNDGTGAFTDISEAAGFDYEMESMSSSFADFDRDGDMDVYISNTSDGNRLYRNDGNNQFTDIGVSAGIAFNSVCWGALWIDFDLDGWEDIYVVDNNPQLSDQNKLYRNNGNSTFTQTSIAGATADNWRSYSNALGDLNNDGLPDMVVNNDFPQQSKVWQHNSTTNHHLTISLTGIQSNREGIGSWVKLYSSGSCQTKYTFCGDNYMSQNSDKLFFGLGSEASVDSLIIEWPSGMVDHFYAIAVNQHLEILEGSSVQNDLVYEPYSVLCEGDSLYLEATLLGQTIWNDGVVGQGRWVSQTGSYTATTTWNDATYTTPEVSIYFTAPISPLIGVVAPSCANSEDGVIELLNPNDYQLTIWNTDEMGTALNQVGEGVYTLWLRDINGCQRQEEIYLDAPEPLFITLLPSDVLCNGLNTGHVELLISGGVAPYVAADNNPSLEGLMAETYTYQYTDSQGCTIEAETNIQEPSPIIVTWEIDNNTGEIQLQVSGGVSPYSFQWNTGATTQNETPVTPGDYFCDIIDANGCLYQVQINYTFVPQSVNELNSMTLNVYPSPAAERCIVQSPIVIASMHVFDGLGRAVADQKIGASQFELFLNDWANGSYILQAELVNGEKKVVRFEVVH